jgi:CheY-like chemotaxis protein
MATVLVVDDEGVSRTIIVRILERAGHRVTACASVVEAIEAVSFCPFDLIVTDILMPDYDGFELVQAARNLRPDIPILVVSSIAELVPAELAGAAFDKLAVNGVVPKPVEPEALTRLVAGILDARLGDVA